MGEVDCNYDVGRQAGYNRQKNKKFAHLGCGSLRFMVVTATGCALVAAATDFFKGTLAIGYLGFNLAKSGG